MYIDATKKEIITDMVTIRYSKTSNGLLQIASVDWAV